jgi:hypothetical protein
MGADKNSSRRSNSVYDPNSQPRIPTWVCQGRVVTTDLPTLGTNPKWSQSESETQEAKDLAALWKPRRTVRVTTANRPRDHGEPSAGLRRTVRISTRNTSTAPSITDHPWWTHGPSAPTQTAWHSSTDHPRTSWTKNPSTKWIEWKSRKNSWWTWRTLGLIGSSQTVCHARAGCPPGEIL